MLFAFQAFEIFVVQIVGTVRFEAGQQQLVVLDERSQSGDKRKIEEGLLEERLFDGIELIVLGEISW